uniref:BED-type domain-containing protein n=1 Tax=Peronospora matthiolae TaxID=2874970 RepID=A0AAV1UZX4_9STRA
METSTEHMDVTAGAALFDASSYTGGAPLIPMDDGGSGEVEPVVGRLIEEAVTTVGQQQQLELLSGSREVADFMDTTADDGDDEKKLGRPSHPAWQYFVRGEKRNRFHYNAHCRLCREHGVDAVAIRGVSGNMIRHLQKCVYCPAEVVTQLKLLCAQKDAANFNKRHQSPNQNVDMLLQETTGAMQMKKARWSDNQCGHVDSVHSEVRQRDEGGFAAGAQSLQLPSVSTDANAERLSGAPLLKPLTHEKRNIASEKLSGLLPPRRWDRSERRCRPLDPYMQSSTGLEMDPRVSSDTDPDALSMSVMSSTLSAGLPWDWVWTEQSALLLGDMQSKIRLPSAELLSSIGAVSHDKQISKMKGEQLGVTLAINFWVAKYPRTSFVLLSLVNALGEATAWKLIDMGIEISAPECLADKITSSLTDLRKRGIHVISIVADTALAYAASRLAVESSGWSSLSIPVLPCFSHLLQMLLGIVMTESDTFAETVGEVTELVRAFSSCRVSKVLQRECGDPEATLVAPTRQNWYSFIEAVDSVRQYEDMLKIISSKVAQASSRSRDAARHPSSILHDEKLRKDSAGNTVDELVECGLSSHAIQTVQSAEFWENVTALSELMSPLKEAYKTMGSTFTSSCSLSDILYLFGRMQQQYEAILSDWRDVSGGRPFVEQVRILLQKMNCMWKLYDHPLMVLGYTFDYNLRQSLLALHQPLLQWLSIGKHAKQYFQSWFCAAPSSQSSSRMLPLSDEVVAQFMEDICAYKERKYPFDLESLCDFDKPKCFYMLISDSHPLMHMFGSRLFSFSTSTPRLSDLIPGKGFIPAAPSTIHPQQTLLPLLRMKLFAHTATRPSNDVLEFVRSNRPVRYIAHVTSHDVREPTSEADDVTSPSFSGVRSGGHDKASGESLNRVWNKRQWTSMARNWKAHWKSETDHIERLQTQRVLDVATPDIALDRVFKEKLPSRLPDDRESSSADV